jgi:hypothetical protein
MSSGCPLCETLKKRLIDVAGAKDALLAMTIERDSAIDALNEYRRTAQEQQAEWSAQSGRLHDTEDALSAAEVREVELCGLLTEMIVRVNSYLEGAEGSSASLGEHMRKCEESLARRLRRAPQKKRG